VEAHGHPLPVSSWRIFPLNDARSQDSNRVSVAGLQAPQRSHRSLSKSWTMLKVSIHSSCMIYIFHLINIAMKISEIEP
jgi:hypothetical protein